MLKRYKSITLKTTMIVNLVYFHHQGKKDVAQVFNNILRRQIGTRSPTVEYICTKPEILFTLMSGYVYIDEMDNVFTSSYPRVVTAFVTVSVENAKYIFNSYLQLRASRYRVELRYNAERMREIRGTRQNNDIFR